MKSVLQPPATSVLQLAKTKRATERATERRISQKFEPRYVKNGLSLCIEGHTGQSNPQSKRRRWGGRVLPWPPLGSKTVAAGPQRLQKDAPLNSVLGSKSEGPSNSLGRKNGSTVSRTHTKRVGFEYKIIMGGLHAVPIIKKKNSSS